MIDVLEMSQTDYDQVVAHARQEEPAECCGLLVGLGSRVHRVRRLGNADRSPATFRADPLELLRAFQQLDAAGLELVGIYHSHPRTEAHPSPTDVRYAPGYPEAVHVIVSLANPAAPVVRAFRITGDPVAIVEEEVVVS